MGQSAAHYSLGGLVPLEKNVRCINVQDMLFCLFFSAESSNEKLPLP
jgi:hypothetical protein